MQGQALAPPDVAHPPELARDLDEAVAQKEDGGHDAEEVGACHQEAHDGVRGEAVAEDEDAQRGGARQGAGGVEEGEAARGGQRAPGHAELARLLIGLVQGERDEHGDEADPVGGVPEPREDGVRNGVGRGPAPRARRPRGRLQGLGQVRRDEQEDPERGRPGEPRVQAHPQRDPRGGHQPHEEEDRRAQGERHQERVRPHAPAPPAPPPPFQ